MQTGCKKTFKSERNLPERITGKHNQTDDRIAQHHAGHNEKNKPKDFMYRREQSLQYAKQIGPGKNFLPSHNSPHIKCRKPRKDI